MQLFSTDENVPGVFAVGQFATGIFVLAQMGTGVVVIGQFGRGVIVLGQFAVGFVAVGQFAVGLISTGGQFAIGGRSFRGLPLLAVFPRLRWPRVAPVDAPRETALAAIESGEVDEGLVRVRVAREDGRVVVKTAASGGKAPLDATLDAAVMSALGAELDAGRKEALVGLLAEARRADTASSFREAPEKTRHLSVQSIQAIAEPTWQTPFLGASDDDAEKPISVFGGTWRLAVWLALCVGWWFVVGQELVAMFR